MSIFKDLSPFQNAAELWESYESNYKTFTSDKALKMFFSSFLSQENGMITKHFYDIVKKCQETWTPREMTSSSAWIIMSYLENTKTRLGVKMMAYDGAYIERPMTGINIKWPVICVDIASQYPSCIRALNMSCETHVSIDHVLNYGIQECVTSTNKRRTDDTISYKEYLELGMKEYVRNNYVFFIKTGEMYERVAAGIEQYTNQINARLAIKKLIKLAKTPEEARVLTEQSDALKININAFYGTLAFIYGHPEFLPAVTSKGRQTIHNIKRTLNDLYGDKIIIRYGDSVTGDTPLLIKDAQGRLHIKRIDNLIEGRFVTRPDGKEVASVEKGVCVWSEDGFTPIIQVARHENRKKIIRVSTFSGVVDVTEDHSLLRGNKEPVKPKDATVGLSVLLHGDCVRAFKNAEEDQLDSETARLMGYNFAGGIPELSPSEKKCVPTCILNAKIGLVSAFVMGYKLKDGHANLMCVRGKEASMGMYILGRRLGYDVYIEPSHEDREMFIHNWLKNTPRLRKHVVVRKQTEIISNGEVYDLTTASHHFHVGPGELIVHNTDSCMFSFDKSYNQLMSLSVDEAMAYYNNNNTSKPWIPYDAIKTLYESRDTSKTPQYQTCKILQELFGTYVVPLLNKSNPKEVMLEVEKVMIPFVQCSQKKYACFIPLTGKPLSRGTSDVVKNSFGATKMIMNRFIELLLRDGEFNPIEMYHFIGREIVAPINDGSIDVDLISKAVSHNTTKKLTAKLINMIERLQDEGEEFLFDQIKKRVITVTALNMDEGWSVVTLEQYKNDPDSYTLHVEKILKDVMSEFMTIVATEYSIKEGVLFEQLAKGKYDPSLSAIPKGGGSYICKGQNPAALKRKTTTTYEKDYSAAVARNKRRKADLPGYIILKQPPLFKLL